MSDKPKRGRPPTKGGRKPGHPIRVRHALYVQAVKASDAEASVPGELVNRLIREGLERLGFWPPK